MKRIILTAAGLLLASCTQAQFTSATSQIASACAEVLPLANLAIGIPTVGPFIAAGVQVGCATDAGIAKLAADPSSQAWLGEQKAKLAAVLKLR